MAQFWRWLNLHPHAWNDWGWVGVGHPGIDLGHARLSAAFDYDLDAADDILTGWTQETGRQADAMPVLGCSRRALRRS